VSDGAAPLASAEPARIRRPREGPRGRYGLASVVLHALGIAAAMGSAFVEPDTPDFVSYQIEIVSLGDGGGAELVIEAPPSAPEPEPEPAPTPAPTPPTREPEPEPQPTAEPPRPTPPRTDPAPTRPAPTPSEPTPEPASPGTGSGDPGDAINVRMEGLRRDYPVYYRNIITQIQRCFRWTGGGTPQTEVYFVINRDGSVSDQRWVTRSGNPTFVITALEAVECAGRERRFGPLPTDLPYDRLPIRFTFRPGGGAGIFR
jgi:outer membrane biosynthesis protein TonB